MTDGLEYQELHHHGRVATWRALIGTALVLILFVWLPVVLAVPFVVGLTLQGAGSQGISDFFELDPVTPGNLAYVDLGLALAIAAAVGVTWLMHGALAPRWLLSVVGRLRWRWLGTCAVLSVLTLTLTLVVASVLPGSADGTDLAGAVNDVTVRSIGFLAVIILLTPWQAAGEEFVFRGYLTQAWGSWGAVRSRRAGRVAAVLVPALIFALAHGLGQDVPVFFDRFAFGVVAGVLVILTGGIEAGLAMHVCNNLVAFGVALFFGDLTTTLTQTSGSWWLIASTLTQSVVYLGLVSVAARRRNLRRTSGPDPVLESSAPAL